MAKKTTLAPIQISAGKWRLNVPAAVSPTGKRQRLFFATKKAAQLEAERIRSVTTLYGTEATKLTGTQAEDAARAIDLLNGYDVSLVTVATDWIERERRRTASVTFSELWADHVERKIPEISGSYASNMRKYAGPVLAEIGHILVSELEPYELERAIQKHHSTPRQFSNACRTIRPAFSRAVRKGYCQTNPFARIEPRKIPNHETTVMSIEQVKAAFNGCRDHRKSKAIPKTYRLDCRDCVPAVALLLFAGVRPKEVTRIGWDDVHFDHETLKVGAGAAKTRSARFVPLNDTLRKWLEQTPEPEREGPIVPANWKEKIKAIRHIAGIGHMPDVMRHSFASYHLAANPDLNALQAAMGHSTPEMVLRHYRALVSKADAIKFWSIRPDSTEPAIRSTG